MMSTTTDNTIEETNNTNLYTSMSTSLAQHFSNVTSEIKSSSKGIDMVSEGAVAGIVLTLIVICCGILLILYCLYKKGQISFLNRCLERSRRRRLSNASSKPLEPIDNGHPGTPLPERREEDVFTIDDAVPDDNNAANDDGYYYDEVFGKSEFQDTITKNAIKNLYTITSTDDDSSLLDDDDLPDLSFK